MRVEVKTGRTEGFVSSYNLFFENGLRLKTDDLTWSSVDHRAVTFLQFNEVVNRLKEAGFEVIGDEVL